jgi:uncharacterized membrane protein/protein-disulfide isomerase
MTADNSVSSIKISISSIVIGVIGFFVSLYALILHIQNLLQPGHGALCDINSTFNCSAVIGSSYGEFASIPLGSYGMAYFIVLISAALLPKISVITKKQHSTLEFILSSIGFLTAISLFYISHFILKTICPTCTIIHLLVVIYFVIKGVDFFKTKKNFKESALPSGSDYLIRFMAICICLGMPPLAAGLIAPIVIDNFFPSYKFINKEKVLTKINTLAAASESASADLNKQLSSFNKTNYVGNGEDYRRGNDEAKVVVQMFSDFGCPHCKEATTALLQAQDQVGLDQVLFVYRFFPLSNKCNPYASSEGWYPYTCTLTQAARCVGVQGKFWEFKEWAFSGQDWTDEQRAQSFSMAGLKEEAKNLGVNADLVEQCIEKGLELNKIKDDATLANKLKIEGTPLILVNGKRYQGPHTVENFVQAIRQE